MKKLRRITENSAGWAEFSLSSFFAKQAVLLFLTWSSFALAQDGLPYYQSSEFTPYWFEPHSEELWDFHSIPSFSFIDQDGQTITDRSMQNKIYVANFFFTTCPGICPTIRSKLSRVQQAFAEDEDVKILSHSIQPSIDTVDVLKDYADKNGIQSGQWHLLTGEKENIYRLAKEAYFASDDLGRVENLNDFLHTENLLLIDPNRNIRGIYNGLSNTSVSYLIEDIKQLKAEISEAMDCH